MERYPSEMSNVNGNRREQQAQATRDEICRVAERLFLESGYVATTIDVIARDAGVAVQTIYNSVGNKATLLNVTLERIVTGSDGAVTVPQFMSERIAAAPDLPSAVQVLADWMVEFNGRAGAIFAVLRQAAAVDPEVDALQRRRSSARLRNYGKAAAQFRGLGGVSPGKTDEETGASIWSLGHPDVYNALVVEAGWTVNAYAHWVRGALGEVLIP